MELKSKRIAIYLIGLIFVALAYAEFNFKVTQEFKKGEGEITITGKTTDEVMMAVARTLFRLKCKIIEKDEDLGLIIAQKKGENKKYNDDGEVISSKEYISDRWEILVESVGDKIILLCSYDGDGAGFWGSKKKSFKAFSEKLEGLLSR